MLTDSWDATLNELRQELALVESGARKVSGKFEELCRKAESFKIELLRHELEKRRVTMARRRGIVALIRDRKNLLPSLGWSAAWGILEGLVAKDKSVGWSTGISSFDSEVQKLGETTWAVSLGKRLAVVPQDHVLPDGIRVTWESLQEAMSELERRALGGEVLGSLDNIISGLKPGRSKLVYLSLTLADFEVVSSSTQTIGPQ